MFKLTAAVMLASACLQQACVVGTGECKHKTKFAEQDYIADCLQER